MLAGIDNGMTVGEQQEEQERKEGEAVLHLGCVAVGTFRCGCGCDYRVCRGTSLLVGLTN